MSKAEYTPTGKWVLLRKVLPTVSGLVLPEVGQVSNTDAMQLLVLAVGPDVPYTLEPGTELWLTPGVRGVATLDDDLFFCHADEIVATVVRNEKPSVIQ